MTCVMTGRFELLLTALTIFSVFAVPPANGSGPPVGAQLVNVRDYGAKCDGQSDDSAAVSSAVGKAKNVAGAIVFAPFYRDPAPPLTVCVIRTDIIIPSTVTTYIVPGALISISPGVTLTILGPFPNERWQTFNEEAMFTVGTGDGRQTVFTGTLPRPTAVSVMVGGSQVGTDDGAGNFIGIGVSGTLVYLTGTFSFRLTTAPPPGVLIQIKKRTGVVSFGEFQSCQGDPHCYSKTNRLLPEWWGAKCDGQNDDTAAIQAAVNASEAFQVSFPNTPSPSVLIPPTPCKISSPLVINLPITLAGRTVPRARLCRQQTLPSSLPM